MTSETLERRLRAALHGTSESPPRPVADIQLPLQLQRLLSPRLLAGLKPAAVLIPVMRRRHGLTVLLTRRADDLRSHSGQISFPGGRREDGDSSLAAAALREAREEVGLPPEHVEVCGYLDDYPTITGYRVTPVVGVIENAPELEADHREVAEIFEAPLDWLMNDSSYRSKIFSRNGVNVPFFELEWEGRVIWGATAGMLWNLAQKMAQR
jgi:8-oxo-dGTP pyrophosphatase MutT (NUDIX family)